MLASARTYPCAKFILKFWRFSQLVYRPCVFATDRKHEPIFFVYTICRRKSLNAVVTFIMISSILWYTHVCIQLHIRVLLFFLSFVRALPLCFLCVPYHISQYHFHTCFLIDRREQQKRLLFLLLFFSHSLTLFIRWFDEKTEKKYMIEKLQSHFFIRLCRLIFGRPKIKPCATQRVHRNSRAAFIRKVQW